ncbi:MAG: cobaltochelatase CobT-related protein [Actinomycetota bacterium]
MLGYTTGAWSGGRPYREWLAAGRPAHPGRLNESLNLVFKDAATSWRRSRSALSGLLWTPTFREGIDGEALEWAHSRLRAIDAQRRYLLLVCDGSPMDGATALTNDEDYLDRHLIEVVESIEADPTVHLAGLGIGHDMSTYLRRSRVVDPDRILDRETARAILGFLAQP